MSPIYPQSVSSVSQEKCVVENVLIETVKIICGLIGDLDGWKGK